MRSQPRRNPAHRLHLLNMDYFHGSTMKSAMMALTLILTLGSAAFADEPAPINFNLVQVNNYNRPAALDTASVPNQRVVIDVQNPDAFRALTPVSYSPEEPKPTKVVNMAVSLDPVDRGIFLPWESQIILHTTSGSDSFLVTSSRTGCPGTEVRPSVSVAFSTPRGWSDPPIRFGPLSDKTVCPLGRGVELKVSSVGGAAPYVKIMDSGSGLSRR